MKLDIGKTLLLGFGFFGVSIIWAIHDSYVPVFLGKDFALDASLVGAILTVNTIIVFLIQPGIGSLSDRIRTPIGRRHWRCRWRQSLRFRQSFSQNTSGNQNR